MIVPICGKTPDTEKAAFVAPNAVLCGGVRLEENATVWFGAVIRNEYDEDVTIGPGSNVQDNCVLHCDKGFGLRLGSGVTVGHAAVVHGAQVGDDVLIGMHATVLNGAKIGAGAVIAAGAVVTENQEIPENALAAGVPARVIRINPPQVREAIRKNAEHYAALGRDYARALAPEKGAAGGTEAVL